MPDTLISLNEPKRVDPWLILSVDDEDAVHYVTELVLSSTVIDGRGLKILKAQSGSEAIEILRNTPDISIILLDVVMESFNAGLDIVPIIRNELNNHEVRIIMRSGQAGQFTILEVIRDYDINGYQEKSKLTSFKLQSAIIFALRDYSDIQRAKMLK